MIEFIKHALGICGEGHPNLFTVLFGSSAIGGYIYYGLIKLKILRNDTKRIDSTKS